MWSELSTVNVFTCTVYRARGFEAIHAFQKFCPPGFVKFLESGGVHGAAAEGDDDEEHEDDDLGHDEL